MADHGAVEYATAAGNDYPAHEGTYERFVLFTFVGIILVVNLLLGLLAVFARWWRGTHVLFGSVTLLLLNWQWRTV